MAAVEFVQAVYILYAVASNCNDVASQAVQDCQRRRFRVNRSQARSALFFGRCNECLAFFVRICRLRIQSSLGGSKAFAIPARVVDRIILVERLDVPG